MSTAKVLFPNDEEIYKIIKGLPNAEKLQDKIWESFCLESEVIQSKNKSPTKQRRFKKHPSNFNKNENDKGEQEEDDCDSLDSDFMADALFGKEQVKNEINYQNAKGQGIAPAAVLKNYDECDSLEEFCDVTYRNMNSVTHKSYKILLSPENIQNHCPRVSTKKTVPSSAAKPPPKMMSPIKPSKKIFLIGENVAIDDDKDSEIEMVTEPMEYDMNKDRKLKTLLQKCNDAMDDIRLLMDIGIPEPDGEEDYLRRKKRALEFSNRFTRIYLYQINRLVTDIRKLLRPYTTQRILHSTETSRSATTIRRGITANLAITHKFVQTLQLVLQSLLAYYNHIPTSIIVGTPDKLKDLLGLCVIVCQLQGVVVCEDMSGGDGGGERENIFTSFNTRSKSLLERINVRCQIESTASLMKSDRSKLSLLGYKVAKGKGDGNSRMQLSVTNSRFSMYGDRGSRKDVYWRNTIAALGKKHFNVSSRYKTAQFKHRPAVERMQYSKSQYNPPFFQAFPINKQPAATNNRKELIANSNANNTCTNFQQGGRILIDQNQSEMSIRIQNVERELVRKRSRPRYSLNDDDVNTVMQDITEDSHFVDGSTNKVTAAGANRPKEDCQSLSSGEGLRLRRKKKHHVQKEMNQSNCHRSHHHKHSPKLPQTPMSTPQTQTPRLLHLDNDLIGDSSQCDLEPPSLPVPPLSVPTSTTPNTLPKEFQTSKKKNCCCCCSGGNYEKCSSKQVEVPFDNCLHCYECRKQEIATQQKKSTEGNDEDQWSRLSIDCDRTMTRLDELTIKRGNDNKAGARKKGAAVQVAEGLKSLQENDEELFQTDENGDKKDVHDLRGQHVEGEKKKISGGDKRRDKITVTSVTGVKNAKLICIRDDNSLTLDTTASDIAEPQQSDNSKKLETRHQNTCSNPLQYVNSETQTEVPKLKQLGSNHKHTSQLNESGGHKSKNVKISRLPKAKVRRQLHMLDKEMSLNIIRYKLEYHRARKENPMYKKAANGVEPWILMEKVSNGILDHLLLSVAREIQVDDILVKLYESEFYAA